MIWHQQPSQGAEAAPLRWSVHIHTAPQVPLLEVLDLRGAPDLASGPWGALAQLIRLERFSLRMEDDHSNPLKAPAQAAFDAAWLPPSLRHLSLKLPPGTKVLHARRRKPPGPVAVASSGKLTLQRQAERA